ncbi:18S rRNA pseudouridine methyltransferase [Mortierella alpina]|nr:18S rRNA pseudouridine methyltransferase [Mortierella alpina]
MNKEVDPCADFSEYVCGNYKRDTPLIDRVSVSDLLFKRNMHTISSIFNDSSNAPNISSEDAAGRRNFQKLRHLYLSCTDERQIRRKGRQPLVDVLKKLVDLFPVKDSPFEFLQNATAPEKPRQPIISRPPRVDPWALSTTLGYLNKVGINAIASLSAKRDSSNATGITFEFDAIGTDRLSEQHYSIATGPGAERINDAFQYESIVDAVAKTLYLLVRPEDNSSFRVSGDALFSDGIPQMWVNISKNVLRFEHQLTKMPLKRCRVSLEHLAMMSYNIDWTLVLRNALPDDVILPSNVVFDGAIFGEFDSVLEGLEKYGPLALQIQSYLVWTVVKHLIRQVDPKYSQFLRPINNLYAERWMYCSAFVSSSMGKVVGPLFTQKVYGEHMNAADMIESIHSQIAEAYGRAVRIDNSTKAREIQRLKEGASFVGHERTRESSETLEEFYRHWIIEKDDYFGNRMRFAAWRTENSLRGLEGFVLEHRRDVLPQDDKIRYDTNTFKIQIPVGIFRPYLFHDDYPTYVNYGGLGVMIAQKFACRDPNLLDQYYCYYENYHNASMNDPEFFERLNGELIANSIGLEVAFDAWRIRQQADKQNKMTYEMAGLRNYSSEQLFFISFGSSLCERRLVADQYRNRKMVLSKLKINGPVANSKDFARAFNCAPGMAMNPPTKCDVFTRPPYKPGEKRVQYILLDM